MPYKSKAQMAYMHIHHPEIAKRWDKEYKMNPKLPKYKKSKMHSNPGIVAPYPHTPKWI